MNPITVLKIMGSMGCRYLESKIHLILDYTTKMCDNGRVIIISDSKGPYSVMFFSVTDDPDSFLKKESYEYKSHDPLGKILYIEKLISLGWNKSIRQEFETEILKKFPQITHGEWHRWAKWGDRRVIAKRRLQHVSN